MSASPASKSIEFSHEEALRRARALVPRLRERAAQAEAMRNTPTESIAEFVDAGLARILKPARWGGHQLSHDAAFDVAVEIGKACGSTAWCCSFLNIHDWWLAGFPEEAQHDVWRDGPDVNVAAVVAPSGKATEVDGGYRLTGLWQWASGIDHAEWALLGGLVVGEGKPPHVRIFLIPKADYTVKDVWQNVGLRGTGSNDVLIDDIFVPAHRTVTMDDMRDGTMPGAALHDSPLYRVPLVCTFHHALSGPALGIARGAYEEWRDWNRTKTASSTGESMAENQPIQVRLALSEMDIDAAELLMRRNLDLIRPGTPIDLALRSRSFVSWGHAVQMLCNAVETMFRASGARGMFDSNPIQRAWRDIHTIASHVGLNTDLSGSVRARVVLGLPRDPRVRMY